MSIEELYEIFIKYPTVSTDSRKIEKDSLFFALKGENFNGNTYASKALENGAAYSIIDEAAFKVNDQTILVEDALTTMQHLATYHRLQLDIPIIAITGTNGKTTTKELVTAVLSKMVMSIMTRLWICWRVKRFHTFRRGLIWWPLLI